MKGTVLAGALGNCVHVAGVVHFLREAEALGYEPVFLGAAVPVEDFVAAILRHRPAIVGVSYRLTPEVAASLLETFDKALRSALTSEERGRMRFLFGGTPPVCEVARQTGLFTQCFDGLEHPQQVRAALGGLSGMKAAAQTEDSLVARLHASGGYPLLRHHVGLPTLDRTVGAVEAIARAGVLDIVSLAPDQNAQESFFRPDQMDPRLDGAGGVPVRTREDLERIRAAADQGNHPLMRIYSGTRDLTQWAALSQETIRNAWGAVPLCWYNALDGRSPRPPAESIAENQAAMRWYGAHGIPLEVNEAHHWSLRDAHDTVAVAAAWLAAWNAKQAGVRLYVSQYMLNTPPTTSPAMDLAKMAAKIELIESLHDDRFTTVRQTRAGLLHLSPRLRMAKGQLAASTVLALQLKPQIVHVVGYCEGDHAAEAEDVIESCEIVQGAIRNCLDGQPDFMADPAVDARKNQLVMEAGLLLDAIRGLGRGAADPFSDPDVLARAIRLGLLDAPHLKGNPHAAGMLETRCVDGAMHAWQRETGAVLTEARRIALILDSPAQAAGAR